MHTELKERVECWFRLLRLAHKSNDTIVQNNLNQTDFYKDWGDYRNMAFTPWWKEHKVLFQDIPKIRRFKEGDLIDSNQFVISIPLVHSPTSVAKIIKEMYGREFSKIADSRRKQKKIFNGKFELTGEMRLTRMHYYLLFIEKIYLPIVDIDPNFKTHVVSKRTVDYFKSYKSKVENKKKYEKLISSIPFTKNSSTSDSSLKNVRNYISVSKNLLTNVSTGIFPGEMR
jgi:hypothetical protein